MRANGDMTPCLQCKKMFYVTPSVKKLGRKFCSKACYTLWIIGNPSERFLSCFNKTNGCWVWDGPKSNTGYGVFNYSDMNGQHHIMAHRYSYELFVGAIPKGLHIDHLCRNTSCVNPKHMEPVSIKENILRGEGISAMNARKTTCKNGHILSGENLYIKPLGERRCRVCSRMYDRIAYYKSKNMTGVRR